MFFSQSCFLKREIFADFHHLIAESSKRTKQGDRVGPNGHLHLTTIELLFIIPHIECAGGEPLLPNAPEDHNPYRRTTTLMNSGKIRSREEEVMRSGSRHRAGRAYA